MSKLKRVERDGDIFVMEVELGKGHSERWTYERIEHDGMKSYILVGRENIK